MVVSAQSHRKKPPSFNHYPAARAKILKKAWVQKAKIRSKWKSERQKMGLPPRNLLAESDKAQEDEDEKFDSEVEGEDQLKLEDKTFATPEPSVKGHHNPARPQLVSTSHSKQPEQPNAPDLRELTRKAYSRETLHTYKSDPLNRRGGPNRGNGRGGAKGRGQPNMKMRMGAMLEKIKRDFT